MKNVNRAAAAVALLLATSSLAQAQDGVVLDYTKRGFRDAEPAVAAADKTRVTSALASVQSDPVKALGKNLVVLGHAKGKSPKAGDVDFFLLSEKPPIAAEPFPQAPAQVIVALKGKDVVGAYVIPAARQYAKLVGAVDMDGDGASEVLLEGAATTWASSSRPLMPSSSRQTARRASPSPSPRSTRIAVEPRRQEKPIGEDHQPARRQARGDRPSREVRIAPAGAERRIE